MSITTNSVVNPLDVAKLLVRYPLRWIVPSVLVAAAAAGYVQTRVDTWEATQTLVVRNEAAGTVETVGKFRSAEDMKALLETVMEVSKSRSVLAAALLQVGPPADRKGAAPYPTAQEIVDLAEATKLTPPKGAEYGKTEVFYLKVKDKSRERAIALATALCVQLESSFGKLRDARAQSLIVELVESQRLAQAEAAAASQKLSALERSVGGDLAELRHLTQTSGGDSDLRRMSLELENELRQAKLAERRAEELHKILLAAQSDANRLLATPAGLLDAQPTLRKLKEGLIEAQMKTSQLLGTMSTAHPMVQAARSSEREIEERLHGEVIQALRGTEIDLRLASDRVKQLDLQVAALRIRFERLAGLRAEYANLLTEVEQRNKLLADADRKVVDARASQSSAQTTSLITRLDTPDTGAKPIGPGRSIILLAGVVGGLAVGLGVLFLTAQPSPTVAVAQQEPPRLSPSEEQARGLSLKGALSRAAAL